MAQIGIGANSVPILYMPNLLRQRQSIEAWSYVEPLGATR
jgi:hypothetical protein